MDRWLDEWKDEFVKPRHCSFLLSYYALEIAIPGPSVVHPPLTGNRPVEQSSFSECHSERMEVLACLSKQVIFTIMDFLDQIKKIHVLIFWSPTRETIHVNACFIT